MRSRYSNNLFLRSSEDSTYSAGSSFNWISTYFYLINSIYAWIWFLIIITQSLSPILRQYCWFITLEHKVLHNLLLLLREGIDLRNLSMLRLGILLAYLWAPVWITSSSWEGVPLYLLWPLELHKTGSLMAADLALARNHLQKPQLVPPRWQPPAFAPQHFRVWVIITASYYIINITYIQSRSVLWPPWIPILHPASSSYVHPRQPKTWLEHAPIPPSPSPTPTSWFV